MKLNTALSYLLWLLFFTDISDSYKILGIFHTFSKSHYIAGAALMKGLAAKGHNVTVISPFHQEKSIINYHEVTVLGIDKRIEEMFPNIVEMDDMGVIDKLNLIFNIGVSMTNYTLSHDVVQNFLCTQTEFDVIVMEIFMNEAFLGLGHHFRTPVIGFSTFGASKWSNDMVGNPTPMSYIPHFQVNFSERINFFQRVGNVLLYLSESAFMYWYMGRQEQIYNDIFKDPKPTLDELHRNVSLVLLNNHFSLHFPRPFVPNMIEVGGLQINRTPNKLPDDLQMILDQAEHGVIYFSLGTNVKSKYISVEKQQEILNVFRKLKQTVLWKWDEPLLSEKIDNVFVNRWYPQVDLLAHPNVKLFITHGGLLSITEAIYHAVPIIGIPLFADQFLNIARAQRAGYAIPVHLKDLNTATLSTAIAEMFTNDKYSKQIKLLSNRYRDQPLTPLETAIYWTEYVIRHNGAPHMRSAGLDLKFFAYHSLDVFAFLSIVIYIFWRLVKWICTELLLKNISENAEPKYDVKK